MSEKSKKHYENKRNMVLSILDGVNQLRKEVV